MKIVFIGDSITDAHHNYSSDSLGDGYVKIIADKLKTAQPDIEIINKGHDGFTVFGLWKFLDQDCISKKPDIVSILIGCNDVSVKMSTGKTLEEQEFQKIYERILKKIRQKTEAKIICMGPFIFPYPQEFENWIPDIKRVEQMTKTIAEKYDALFLPLHDMLQETVDKLDKEYMQSNELKQNERYMPGMLWRKQTYEKITTDGTHLTAFGAKIVAEKWLEATANWLDKKDEIS